MAIDFLPVRVRGKKYAPKKLTQLPKKYIWIDDQNVLYCLPLPLLVVESVTAAHGSNLAAVTSGNCVGEVPTERTLG